MLFPTVFTSRLISKIFIFVMFVPVLSYTQNLLNGPNDIVFDEVNNRYLVANWAGNSIVEIDLQGNQSYFINNVFHAHGMEILDSALCIASYHSLLLLDLSTADTIQNIYISGSNYLGHITWDSSQYVYVTDWSIKRLFRVNMNNQTSTILHSFSSQPVGVYYEKNNNRLIILTLVNNAPILAYHLTSGNLDTLKYTNINNPDAICRDADGNYYVTSFSDNTVYKFDHDFSTDPEIISTGHGGPSGMGYNMRDNIIGVTNYNFNSIDLIELDLINIEYKRNIKFGSYILLQNYPNPFNPATNIEFSIPKSEFVTLKVYNILGEEVATLVSQRLNAGEYKYDWDASSLASGVYPYRIQAGDYVESKKMVLLR